LEVPAALISIANQSSEARDSVISAMIQLLNDSSDGDDTGFYLAVDVLGILKAVEAVDLLVKYLDYQPGFTGTSLLSKPAVRGLIQIGEAAIPRITEALMSGKSVLHEDDYWFRYNARTALLHIGGVQAQETLKRVYDVEKDERLRGWVERTISEINRANRDDHRPRPAEIKWSPS